MSVQPPRNTRFIGLAIDGGLPPSETSDIYHMHDPLIERTYPIIRGFIAGRIPPWSFADRLREVGVPECIFATREFQLLLQREYEVDCLPFNTVRLVLKRLIKACRDKRFRARHGDRFDDTRDEATSTDDRMFSRTVSKLEESAVQTDGMDLTRVHGTPLEHRVGLSPEKRLQYLPLNERQCYLRDEQQRETSKGGDSETWTRPRSQRH
ncbi:hypothetical protein Pmar_PMAR006634 [Perkinsus marinus ATCC 50983]|uniref:Uncharacterized protein n=1 Tax=Perkinsus marinus (strain ATCC 50983 / TXsc) TaxID=423536 RepID=C5LLU0_PERM5|nr:hypothetical protein Pmar_PMAR006634 [Perkinsus marinus ATCC 50983]EER02312.1 hypothetical protein Pmar_PMAR006634 [Perkinsus marinus ATCC 50983]|eukprot:XP_002769594.1 hypothetical protein Pmar_PMAR006634 [Perkinsus marinus ATCC 50983]